MIVLVTNREMNYYHRLTPLTLICTTRKGYPLHSFSTTSRGILSCDIVEENRSLSIAFPLFQHLKYFGIHPFEDLALRSR